MPAPEPRSDIASDSAQPCDFDALISRILAGESAAWSEFVGRAYPAALAICHRRRFVGGIGDPEDTARDVALRTLDRIYAADFAALRAFTAARARHPSASFVRWLAVVVGNTYVDYLRSQPDYQRRRVATSRRLQRLSHAPLDDETPEGNPVDPLSRVEIRRIVDCLQCDVFPRQQRVAIAMWLRGNDASEIAAELGLDSAEQARKLLHAARQRLRRAVHGGVR